MASYARKIPAVVIGGGQSGLAAARALLARGFRPVVLEAGAEPVGSWPQYYDSLKLFTPVRFNGLPGLPFPGHPDRFPSRDDVVAYLRAYAASLDCEIRTRTRVESVLCEAAGFVVRSADGSVDRAPVVISATGEFSSPHRPDLGLGPFTGRVLHSCEYRAPEEFAGQRVVVVGAGNSGVQIAVELAGHARTTLASRRPPRIHRMVKPGQEDKRQYFWDVFATLGRLPLGPLFFRKGEMAQYVLDNVGGASEALKARRPDARPLFTAADGDTLTWRDGTREHVDAVILATGFRPGREYLRTIGALDPAGRPRQWWGVSTTHPGLGYVGLFGQRALYTGSLGGAGWDADYVARALRRKVVRRLATDEVRELSGIR
ncbi:putative flavoprotein involved in K+ transport [Crossiella equi]|uniref:Flavoprotein involved in K+ transport n=1 Tax=Crossiella equi TaxID=130796 RepID=A0ABS5A7X7_9PSEU|nr:NAD(P)/FAD-dependent oxidoreductase [Crossiella equi]MBP2472703.1 putative flavoprotein involved in K+ transport [Crossiella equi]